MNFLNISKSVEEDQSHCLLKEPNVMNWKLLRIPTE